MKPILRQAKAEPKYLTILGWEVLPDGVEVVTLPLSNGYGSYLQLPMVLSYEGKLYGRSGWNSDKNVAYYRTDVALAKDQSR